MSGQGFSERKISRPDFSDEKIFPGGIHVKVLFSPEVKWRLIESFGPHCFAEREDGLLLFEEEYTNEDHTFCHGCWDLGTGPGCWSRSPSGLRFLARRKTWSDYMAPGRKRNRHLKQILKFGLYSCSGFSCIIKQKGSIGTDMCRGYLPGLHTYNIACKSNSTGEDHVSYTAV